MKYLLLSLLQEPMTFTDILDITKGDRLVVNTILDRLRKEGLIKRSGSRRKYVYCLTCKGLVALYIMKLKGLLRRY